MLTALITTMDPFALAPLVWALAGLYVAHRLGVSGTAATPRVHDAGGTAFRRAA